ncbi:GNAT family N-acetyltransferase [Halalkalibacterium halodurans]|nr:GNAT family N-acetyltransferase [Halalkalibacterium halodurans]
MKKGERVMTIVHAEKKDAKEIHSVLHQAFDEYRYATPPTTALREAVSDIEQELTSGTQVLLYKHNDKCVGMVKFVVHDKQLYFFRLSVIPEARNQGIARRLIDHLMTLAKEQKCATVVCKVRADMAQNVAFYDSLGFANTKEEMMERSDGARLNVITMEYKLGGR